MYKQEANVLVTSAGGIVAQGIIKSLKLANSKSNRSINYKIITSDMKLQSAGLFRSDKRYIVPPASSAEFTEEIMKIINNESIKAIFIGSDEELFHFSNIKDLIEEKTEAKIIIESKNVLQIARDKWKTYQFLKTHFIPCPLTYLPDNKDDALKDLEFPMVVKPREGYGSKLFFVVHDEEEINFAIRKIVSHGWKPIIQEFMDTDNNEYTTGITINQNKNMMSSISILKFIRQGQTHKAIIRKFDNISQVGEKVALKLDARFTINVQSIVNKDTPKVIEINPRFSASCPMRAAADINEPDFIFRNHILNEQIIKTDHKNLLCMRYWNEIYVPLNINGEINNNTEGYSLNYF